MGRSSRASQFLNQLETQEKYKLNSGKYTYLTKVLPQSSFLIMKEEA
jgi:hypothetical protein